MTTQLIASVASLLASVPSVAAMAALASLWTSITTTAALASLSSIASWAALTSATSSVIFKFNTQHFVHEARELVDVEHSVSVLVEFLDHLLDLLRADLASKSP